MRHDAIRGGSLSTARRVVATCLGVALIFAAAAALVVRFTPIPTHGVLYVVIAAPYLMLAAPAAIAVLAWGRRWALVAVAALLTAVLVALQVPWFIGTTPDPASVAVRTMTVNMLYGLAEPDAVTRLAEQNADVLMAQELTPEAARGLRAAGIDEAFPYQSLEAASRCPPAWASTAGIRSRSHHRIEGYPAWRWCARTSASPTSPATCRC